MRKFPRFRVELWLQDRDCDPGIPCRLCGESTRCAYHDRMPDVSGRVNARSEARAVRCLLLRVTREGWRRGWIPWLLLAPLESYEVYPIPGGPNVRL